MPRSVWINLRISKSDNFIFWLNYSFHFTSLLVRPINRLLRIWFLLCSFFISLFLLQLHMFFKCLVLSQSPSLSSPFSVAISLALHSSFFNSVYPHPFLSPSLLPLSLSAWPNRLFMGWNQCKCCEYHSSISFLSLFPLNHSSCLLSHTPFLGLIRLSFAVTCWCAVVVRLCCGRKWQKTTLPIMQIDRN